MEDAMHCRGPRRSPEARGSMASVTLLGVVVPRVLVMLLLAVLVLSWGAAPTSATTSGDQETVVSGWTRGAVVSAGLYHTCAIKSNGTATCWGLNTDGQASPTATLGTLIALSSGGSHSCAIKSDGTAVCWGLNNYGQATPPAGLGPIISISAGHVQTCAIKSNGTSVCWG